MRNSKTGIAIEKCLEIEMGHMKFHLIQLTKQDLGNTLQLSHHWTSEKAKEGFV